MAKKIDTVRLKEDLAYDPETGIFTWKRRVARRVCVGKEAGCINTLGYRVIATQGVRPLAHRLAWLFYYGDWPKYGIDHINGNRADNRICNLRDVTQSINCQNLSQAKSHNKVGLLGVQKNKKKFAARIKVDGVQINLGSYRTPEQAHKVYLQAKRELHQGCTI